MANSNRNTKRFNSGQFGRLTFADMNQNFASLDWLIRNQSALEELLRVMRGPLFDRRYEFYAKLTAVDEDEGNNFRSFTWVEVVWDGEPGGPGTWETLTDGRSGTAGEDNEAVEIVPTIPDEEDEDDAVGVNDVVILRATRDKDGVTRYRIQAEGGGGAAPGPGTPPFFPALLGEAVVMGDEEDKRWLYPWSAAAPRLVNTNETVWVSTGTSNDGDCQRAVNIYEMASPASMENFGGGTMIRQPMPAGTPVAISTRLYSLTTGHQNSHDCVTDGAPHETAQRYFYAVNPVGCG